jgi:hypothetical protein
MAQTRWTRNSDGTWTKVLSGGTSLHSDNQEESRQRDKDHTHETTDGYSFKADGKNVGGSNEVAVWAATAALLGANFDDEDYLDES